MDDYSLFILGLFLLSVGASDQVNVIIRPNYTSSCCRAEPNKNNQVRQRHGSGAGYESNFLIKFDSAVHTIDSFDNLTLARH